MSVFLGVFKASVFFIFTLSLLFQHLCIRRIRKLYFEKEKKEKSVFNLKDKFFAAISLSPFTIFFLCLFSEKEKLEKQTGVIPQAIFNKSKRDARIYLGLSVFLLVFFSIAFFIINF